MYGLPQAGKIANTLLKQLLANHRYREVKHTLGLWKYDTRPVTFTLVVDDFRIKFVGDKHIHHLIKVLKQYYTIEIDWTRLRYCGISLDWDYSKRILDINMH
eukprot:12587969-Ditylum_brightwellii.AAC.1